MRIRIRSSSLASVVVLTTNPTVILPHPGVSLRSRVLAVAGLHDLARAHLSHWPVQNDRPARVISFFVNQLLRRSKDEDIGFVDSQSGCQASEGKAVPSAVSIAVEIQITRAAVVRDPLLRSLGDPGAVDEEL